MRELAVMLIAVVLSAMSAVPASAQSQPEPKRVCFRGRPATHCRAFWLTEAGYYWRLGGTDFVEQFATASFEREHLDTHVSWEVGGMVNRGPVTAVGATLLAGMDNRGGRLGLKGRYRRWLGNDEGTFDVSGGVVSAIASAPYPELSLVAFGPTADVSIGWREVIAGTARAEMLWRRDGRPVNAFYGGVRLSSYAALAGTATAAIIVGVLIAGFLIGAGDI